MFLWPIRYPCLGLSITTSAIHLLEVHRDWRRGWAAYHVRDLGRRELPPGLLRVSPGQSNVTDVAALAQEIRTLAGKRTGLPVALSLPDHCARLALFESDTLPKKPAEFEAMVRWRFQTECHAAVTDDRLAYCAFKPTGRRAEDVKGVKVLAMAMRQDVCDGYLQAAEAAGLIPARAVPAGLGYFDACLGAMNAGVRGPRGAPNADAPSAFFLYMSEDGLSFLAFHHGSPVLLRTKSRRGAASESGAPFESWLAQEVQATLEFYRNRFVSPQSEAGGAMSPLFAVRAYDRGGTQAPPERAESRSPDAQDVRPSEAVEEEPLCVAARAASLPLTVVPLGWDTFPLSRVAPSRPLSASGLPAFGAVVAA